MLNIDVVRMCFVINPKKIHNIIPKLLVTVFLLNGFFFIVKRINEDSDVIINLKGFDIVVTRRKITS